MPVISAYGRRTNEMVVSIWASIVDVRSGEVVATTTGEGTGTRRSRRIGAGFLRAIGGGGVSSGSSSSRDAQLAEAVREAADAAAQGLLNAAPRMEHAHLEDNP